MKITKRFLKKHSVCGEGYEWYFKQENKDCIYLYKKLVKENRCQWANWFLDRKLNQRRKKQYSFYAAKFVLPIFEKEFPKDKRPRKAIEAAIKCIKNNTKENRTAAYSAANAVANAVANAAANAVANAAANAVANAAANAAYAAANAAYAAYATNAAAAYAAYAAANNVNCKKKILNYEIKLLKNKT